MLKGLKLKHFHHILCANKRRVFFTLNHLTLAFVLFFPWDLNFEVTTQAMWNMTSFISSSIYYIE